MNVQRARPDVESVLLGLGTNQGDRLRHLRRALFALAVHPEIRVLAVSSVYETEFVGEGEQDPYLNACVEIETGLTPAVLLAVLKAAEAREGREPDGHQRPRPIDLDILLFGDRRLESARLCVPHKGMRDRAFVLEPLAEIAAGRTFPDSGETIGNACAKIRRKSGPWIRTLAGAGLNPEGPGPSRGGNLNDLDKEAWRAALALYCR